MPITMVSFPAPTGYDPRSSNAPSSKLLPSAGSPNVWATSIAARGASGFEVARTSPGVVLAACFGSGPMDGRQPQTLAVPPPPQVSGSWQAPQVRVRPQAL